MLTYKEPNSQSDSGRSDMSKKAGPNPIWIAILLVIVTTIIAVTGVFLEFW
ncbi:hypothetical protein [Christiangramia salexigens]|uniref:hypothetical protein n=1 Tax=Christiangramia salexigens TaxID=1913577 RepID=UPI0012EB9226|nr:hypothetical protein [Christiangramia salexigens]